MGSINRHAIKALRKLSGWTLRDMAERSGVDIGTLSRIESGERRNPNPKVILKIADTLGVPVACITNVCELCEDRVAS